MNNSNNKIDLFQIVNFFLLLRLNKIKKAIQLICLNCLRYGLLWQLKWIEKRNYRKMKSKVVNWICFICMHFLTKLRIFWSISRAKNWNVPHIGWICTFSLIFKFCSLHAFSGLCIITIVLLSAITLLRHTELSSVVCRTSFQQMALYQLLKSAILFQHRFVG